MSGEVNCTGGTKRTESSSCKSQVSRRQFMGLASTLGAGLALSACRTAPQTGTPAASEGYSIFRETMVEMPWPEVRKAAEADAIVLLPIAVIEEHGPHMGLGADTYLTYLWTRLTRHALEAKGIQTLIAPPYYWGINVTTGSFPGSFTVREQTMKLLLFDIHASLRQWGFRFVFSLNLHGDPTHRRVLQEAIQKIHDDLGFGAYLTEQPQFFPSGDISLSRDYHAGTFETAWMAAEFAEDVDLELAKTLEPHYEFTSPGYYGDPAQFEKLSLEEMKKWQEAFAGATADWIEHILKKEAT